MTNKNTAQDEELNEVLQTIAMGQEVYARVLERLNLKGKSEEYVDEVLETLKMKAQERVVMAIWTNMTPEQELHLKAHIAQGQKQKNGLSTDDTLIQFALMYDDLMVKVYDELGQFFEDFVSEFNKLAEVK